MGGQNQDRQNQDNQRGQHGFNLDRRGKYLRGPSTSLTEPSTFSLRDTLAPSNESERNSSGQSGDSSSASTSSSANPLPNGVGIRAQDLRGMSSQNLALMRRQIEERKATLLKSFAEALDEQEKELVGSLKLAKDMRNGAWSNYQRDIETRDEQTGWGLTGAINYCSGLSETYKKQVETSHRMWQDHDRKVDLMEDTHQNATSRKNEALDKLTELLDHEAKKIQLLEQLRQAEEQGQTERAARLEASFNALLNDPATQSLEQDAQQALAKAFVAFEDSSKPVDYAKHRAMLRAMNEDFEKGIQNLNTTEKYMRIGAQVVLVTAAGAFALSTAGAGTPVLLAALYAGAAGGVGKMVINSAETAGHVAYGNVRSSEEIQQRLVEGVKDGAWTGVECFVTGLGMGWAGRAMRLNNVALKLAARGQFGVGPRALQVAALRNTNFLWRNSFAVRNAWRMATPNTFYHTGMQLYNGQLEWKTYDKNGEFNGIRIDNAVTSVLGNYAIATVCAGNSHMGSNFRQSITTSTSKQIFSREFAKGLFTRDSTARREGLKYLSGMFWRSASFSGEKYLDYKATDWGSMIIARRLGVDVNSEAFQEQRRLNLLTGALGDVTGMASTKMQMRGTATQQRIVDTISSGATNRTQAQQHNTMMRTTPGEVTVVATTRPRAGTTPTTGSHGKVEVEVSSNPRMASADAAAANGKIDRQVVRSVDDGHIDTTLRRSHAHAQDAIDNNVPGGKRDAFAAQMMGRQPRSETDAIVSSTLKKSVSDRKQLGKIVEDISTGGRKTQDEKLAIIEDAIGRPLTERERGKLTGPRGLVSDEGGDIEAAFLRNANLHIDENDAVATRRSIEENTDSLIAEANAATRRSAAGEGLDAAHSPGFVRRTVDSVSDTLHNTWGRFNNWRQQAGVLNAIADVGTTFVGHGFGTIGTFGAQLVHSVYAGVNTGPLLSARPLVFDGPLALFTSGLRHSKPWRRTFTPVQPRDAAHAFALRAEVQHRIRVIENLQSRGLVPDLDPRIMPALKQSEADLTVMFERSNKGGGLRRFGAKVFDSDSKEAEILVASINEAANRGLQFDTRGQVQALRDQGLAMIRNPQSSARDFEGLVALGRDSVDPDVMNQIVSEWQTAINTRVRQEGSSGTGSGTSTPRGTGPISAAEQQRLDNIHYASMRNNNRNGNRPTTEPSELTTVLNRFRDNRQESLQRSDWMTLDTVYRREQVSRSVQEAEAWIANPTQDTRGRFFKAVAGIDETNTHKVAGNNDTAGKRMSADGLETVKTRLEAEIAATTDSTKREQLQFAHDTLMQRVNLRENGTRIMNSAADAEALTTQLQTQISDLRTRSGGKYRYSASEELAHLDSMLGHARHQRRTAKAASDTEAAALWKAKESAVIELMADARGRISETGHTNLPKIEGYQVAGRRQVAVEDIRDTKVQTVEHNVTGRQDTHTTEDFTLRTMLNDGAAGHTGIGPTRSSNPYFPSWFTPFKPSTWGQRSAVRHRVDGDV